MPPPGPALGRRSQLHYSTRRSPTRASAPNTSGQHGEVHERDADRGRGAVDGRVERLQGGLEGKHERDRADRVVEAAGHRPGGDEREEGERQRQQEGQQRGGAHLARERADRHAERAERERAEGERHEPQARRDSSRARRTRRSRRASRRRPRTRSRRRAASSRRAAPRGRPGRGPGARARALRARAPRRRRRAERRRTSATRSRRRPPRTCSAACVGRAAARSCTRIGWPIVESTCLASDRFWAAKLANASIRSSSARSGPRRLAGDDRAAASGGIWLSPIRFSGAPRTPRLPPFSSEPMTLARRPAGSVRRSRGSPARAPS